MKTLNAKETGQEAVAVSADVDMGVSTLLTADYVHDVGDRLTLYKRLSSAHKQ